MGYSTILAISAMSTIAGFCRGSCGFGMGIAMNAGILFSGMVIHTLGNYDWSFPMYEVVCLITSIDCSFIPALTLVHKEIHTQLAVALAVPRAIFLVVGLFVLLKFKSETLCMILGALVTAFTVWQWSYGTIPEMKRRKLWEDTQKHPKSFYFWAVTASSFSGVTSGFAGVTSPPVQVLVLLSGMPKATFRATWICVNSILKPIQLFLLLLLRPHTFRWSDAHHYGIAIAFAWGGLCFGNWCHHRMTEKMARQALMFLLSISSVVLLFKSGPILGTIGGITLAVTAILSIMLRKFHSAEKDKKDTDPPECKYKAFISDTMSPPSYESGARINWNSTGTSASMTSGSQKYAEEYLSSPSP
ncbi:hypothetical protein AAMO2058_001122100 [Amorphochlora amoebiformis]